jgi:hypothetical protein
LASTSLPNLGPVWSGGRSLLDQDLTHPTSGLPLYPAFDDAFAEGRAVLAPEGLIVTRASGSRPGDAFYAQGDSGLRYWFGHLALAPPAGRRFRRGQVMGYVGPNHIGGGPHVHVGVNAESFLGLGRELAHHTNYTHGAPTVRAQLTKALAPKDGYWQWLAWDLGDGAYTGHRRDPKMRPDVPARVPKTWWLRRLAFMARRK